MSNYTKQEINESIKTLGIMKKSCQRTLFVGNSIQVMNFCSYGRGKK